MTDQDLTSQEQVNKSIGMCRLHGLHNTEATLRALSAALAAEKEENRWAYIQAALDDQKDERSKLEARAEAAEAKLKEAARMLRHMVNHAEWREENEGVFWEATEQSRAFLSSMGDKP